MGYVADMAMPQALVCIGASFQGTEALEKKSNRHWPSLLIKLMVLPGVFLPLCVALGLRGEYLAAVLVMQGSPHHQHGLLPGGKYGRRRRLSFQRSGSTTVLSAFSLTFGFFSVDLLA